MKNDIDCHLFSESLNIDKVGKYGKFVEFEKDKGEVYQFDQTSGLLRFHKKILTKEKLTEADRFLGMVNMKEYLDLAIEDELKQNWKLQQKIKKIQIQTKTKIDKLKEKPKKKIQEKYNYQQMEKYFMPDFSEASSSSSVKSDS